MTKVFSSIQTAIATLKSGKMIILVDNEKRENEGDLVIAADFITPEAINFMAKFGKGLICLAMSEEQINRLDLPMMTTNNGSPFKTAFTVSIEAASGVSTGISAYDRAHTIKTAIKKDATKNDIISPGHVFPLKAKVKGVLERQGQTEGSVDLAVLAGLTPAAVICEIIDDNGQMCRLPELKAFAHEHDIPIVSIEDLIHYRIMHENLITEVARAKLPTEEFGNFDMIVFKNSLDDSEHFALIKNDIDADKPVLVRIHSECITGDMFGSLRCDCGQQLHNAQQEIAEHGGILIYLRQEGRGIGLSNKIKAYALQEQGYDTVDANIALGLEVDTREYAIAYQILKYLQVDKIRLMTNNPNKISALKSYGIDVVERTPVLTKATEENSQYLKTKKSKLGHLL